MIVLIVLIVAGAAIGITALVTHSGSDDQASLLTTTTITHPSPKVLSFTVQSGAMEPTIQPGSTISVVPLDGAKPGRGAIVVFSAPPAVNCGGPAVNDLVKRVIGLPGETISLGSGYVYIDGRRLKEYWLPSQEQGVTNPGPGFTAYSLGHAYRIPSGDYFVMGDNRTDSCDSRYWGPVPLSDVIGVVPQGVTATTSP